MIQLMERSIIGVVALNLFTIAYWYTFLFSSSITSVSGIIIISKTQGGNCERQYKGSCIGHLIPVKSQKRKTLI